MKVAVINFSGNVGKSTITQHLLVPRIPGASLLAIETINADGPGQSLRGSQFGVLQEFLQSVKAAVVDVGASNVEDLMRLMHRFEESHEDFDCFVVPTVPEYKQQHDTIATIADLHEIGVPAHRIRIVFNMVDDRDPMDEAFEHVLDFVAARPIAMANTDCWVGINEVFPRVKAARADLATLAQDETNYKRLIARAPTTEEKVSLAHKLATRRLARGVIAQLDACFAALDLQSCVRDEHDDEEARA